MARSNPFPGTNYRKVKRSPEFIEREKARWEELDARSRLYVTADEIAAMQRGLGRVDLCFGPSGTWLRSYSNSFPAMFNFLLEYRQQKALADQFVACQACNGSGVLVFATRVYEPGCCFAHDSTDERPCTACDGTGKAEHQIKSAEPPPNIADDDLTF